MSIFGEPTARELLGWRLREQIRRLAVEGFGGVEVQVPVGDSGITRPGLGDPLAGVRAAMLARDVAAGAAQDHVRDARAAGRSWDEVAAALGVGEDGYRSRAERAFDEAAGPADPFRGASVWWTCASCGQRVSDTGPYESHPADNEDGHTDSCPRHRAAVAAWQRRRDQEEGEL